MLQNSKRAHPRERIQMQQAVRDAVHQMETDVVEMKSCLEKDRKKAKKVIYEIRVHYTC